jgi:hypothetical protein
MPTLEPCVIYITAHICAHRPSELQAHEIRNCVRAHADWVPGEGESQSAARKTRPKCEATSLICTASGLVALLPAWHGPWCAKCAVARNISISAHSVSMACACARCCLHNTLFSSALGFCVLRLWSIFCKASACTSCQADSTGPHTLEARVAASAARETCGRRARGHGRKRNAARCTAHV